MTTQHLTPFQRGLLRGIALNKNLDLGLYNHLKPQSKRSVNLLIKRGYLVKGDEAITLTETGRAIAITGYTWIKD